MTLADSLLFRYIHPLDPPGKTVLQCVDAESIPCFVLGKRRVVSRAQVHEPWLF
jgi:hypothetical protein